jgi:SAM-dependent methyltransferase
MHESSGVQIDQVAYWNETAAGNWIAHQDRLDAAFGPATELAIEQAAPKLGERALDIGSGCGATVLELVRRVGLQGHVLGIDVSRPMSERARQRIAAAGIAHVEIVVADAASYAFPPAERDLLFSRFGVMFFTDPVAALSNLRRAMRPGGRLQWIVWRRLEDNPWFLVPLEAARPLLPSQPQADPFAPGPFAFADSDRVRHLLESAGWGNVRFVREEMQLRIAAADAIEGAAEMASSMGPVARQLAAQPECRSAVRQAIATALHAHASPDGILLPASFWFVSASGT